jgi:hypothetical protein
LEEVALDVATVEVPVEDMAPLLVE